VQIKSAKSFNLVIGSVLVALTGLVIILFRGMNTDLVGNMNMAELFRKAHQLDHQLNENVLRSRAFLVQNYDPMVHIGADLSSLCKELKSSNADITLANAYCSEVEKKLDAIEHFKSANSVLRNSLKYLPEIVNSIHGVNQIRAKELYSALLKYNIEATSEQSEAVSDILNQMSLQSGAGQDALLLNLYRHGRAILTSLDVRHKIEVEVLSPAVEIALDKLQEQFNIDNERAEQSAFIYRICLLSLVAALGLLLARIFASLHKARILLSDLNTDLEFKVEVRTEELRLANSESEKKQLLLVQSSKMAALGEMAGGVAHEINNPLSVIALKVDQLEEALHEGAIEPSEFLESLGIVRKTCERIGKIVSGLRIFARDGGNLPVETASLDLIVQDTLALCSERFSNHGVTLEVRDYAAPGAAVDCRPIEISQVLLNLLNNSYDAIDSFEEKWIRIDIVETPTAFEIGVTDSGRGITPEIQDKILQPFFSTKEIGKGTGLGLSISKGIIESHSGKLYLDRNCANTRFVISLPKWSHEKASGLAACA
jgi:signal transduction histidine kinase